MNLRDYEQHKFTIAEILRAAAPMAAADAHDWQQRLRDLFVRLAEDRFNLAVVGRVNRGKTSLMNAILGTDRLPVGIVPLTSVITTVSYGTMENAVVRFDGSNLTQEVPIEALHQYVTQKGNPGNARGIRMAEVHLRADILRRGFYFVDTPGLASAVVENTRTTEAFLPEADAFLVVTSFESPMTEEEFRFLCEGSASARRIFVVVNKQDTVSAYERRIVHAFIRDQLRAIFGEAIPQLFSISARQGLDAKRCLDDSRLAASGIPDLQKALVGFLTTEKREQFLIQFCGRVADLIAALPVSSETRDLLQTVKRLQEMLRRQDAIAGDTEDAIETQSSDLPSLRQLEPCEVCAHINSALWEFECKYQYDLSMDRDEQRHFAENGGLCGFHTWQYHAVASPYGICTAYPLLLDHLIARLRSQAESPRPDASDEALESSLSTPELCILCKVRGNAETEAVSKLRKRFSERGVAALDVLSAICIPHLEILADTLKNPELVRKLMDHAATLIERLSEDMKRFALKRDASRRALESKEEITAAERALLLVAGHRNAMTGSIYVATGRFKSAMASALIGGAAARREPGSRYE